MVVCCRVTGPVSGLICLYRLLSLQPTGVPVVGEDVIKETVSLPDLEDGQVLVKVLYFSLDPFVRGSMNKVSYGREMPYPRVCTAFGAGVVAASKNDEFPVGTKVTCMSGWQEYYVHDPKAPGSKLSAVKEGRDLAHCLGVLGMPGATAYLGFLEICQPKEEEVVAVSAAAGAVGALVVQIAKIKGCKVVGFAGGEEKCGYVVKTLGADACIDYRDKSLEQLTSELKEASGGVDCYFDNVGGPITQAVFENLNQRARVSVCGQIVYYNMTPEERAKTQGLPLTYTCLSKQARVEGFMVPQWPDWSGAHDQLEAWIKEGKLKVLQDVHEGIDASFDAFLTLFRGASSKVNFGKLLVKVAAE
eukprot:m.129128 g.129128  ORF g.129128 m.129128 type:complete len:360 (+) comp16753_c0_seq2:385-1464(+)